MTAILETVVATVTGHQYLDIHVDLDADLRESSTLGRKQYHLARETRFPMVTSDSGGREREADREH